MKRRRKKIVLADYLLHTIQSLERLEGENELISFSIHTLKSRCICIPSNNAYLYIIVVQIQFCNKNKSDF